MKVAVVIPAIKKNVAFPDDLVKKLAGVPLIQRAIECAARAFSRDQVHVVTDSEEIALLCERQAVRSILDRTLRLGQDGSLGSLRPHLLKVVNGHRGLLVLSPYVPLLSEEELRQAYRRFLETGADLLIPVHSVRLHPYVPWQRSLEQILHGGGVQEMAAESRAFLLLKGDLLYGTESSMVEAVPYPLAKRLIEIRGYEDWWLCEKLINRRRLVFRVIGHKDVGMGHIYRALALAHEITDHEIRFVCDTQSAVAANKLAGYDYWLGYYEPQQLEQAILDLQPDLVVNDILDTEADYIHRLKARGIRVVNFEDLGSGAADADLTINDLYDQPQIAGEHILWGREWFFVRDEFSDAQPQQFADKVQRLLITFGGTDPSDLTRKVMKAIAPYCSANNIAIEVVTGDGYGHIEDLEKEAAGSVSPKITYNHATGVISKIMERCQIAISSNGRTVYELAHMNIPGIIFSHHDREITHHFAQEDNGYLPLGLWEGQKSADLLLDTLRRLVEDRIFRQSLFQRTLQAHFTQNKRKVVNRILKLLEPKPGAVWRNGSLPTGEVQRQESPFFSDVRTFGN